MRWALQRILQMQTFPVPYIPQLSPQKRPMVITSKPANEDDGRDMVFYSFSHS